MTRRNLESSTLSRGLVAGRRLLAVDGDQELVTIDPAEPVEHEVGEEQLAQGARQGIVDPPPLEPDHEPAAELDPRLAFRRHRSSLERSAKGSGKPGRDHRPKVRGRSDFVEFT